MNPSFKNSPNSFSKIRKKSKLKFASFSTVVADFYQAFYRPPIGGWLGFEPSCEHEGMSLGLELNERYVLVAETFITHPLSIDLLQNNIYIGTKTTYESFSNKKFLFFNLKDLIFY